ncbi:MAG: nitrite/sulfite reductase [Sulfurimonas sp.]|nr:nitrite/sulfite reductase [Sulfurimonas sp.]
MSKETKAQRIERIKKEKSGLDVLESIHEYAIYGTEVDPEDVDRFKWYGLYSQNRNLQDADDETQYFMLRVKLVQGSMNLEQIRVVASISKEFARGTASFTTRQDVQFHFIRVRDLPEIFHRLKTVGLTSVFAAGDVPRNIATCPVAGVDHSEIYDVRELVSEVDKYFDGNRTLDNLPRKYKVGISGCSKHCMGHEIQDLSFTAVKRKHGQILFDVSVGGGLASNKQFAMHIGYVMPEQILEVVRAVSEIYRDHGLRENRIKARLGHLINIWGIADFKKVIEGKMGFELAEELIQEYTPYSKREHFGIYESKDEGKSYVGCAVNGGFMGAKGLEDLANILEKNGATAIKATPAQNFVVLDVPTQNSEDLVEDLSVIDIDANPNPFKARTLSCTGLNYCKFAISETKDTAIALAKNLHEKFPDFNETVSISLNGCPNSCAHSNIVDIGLLGTKFKNDNGETVSGFELSLGGQLEGAKSSFGKKTGLKFISDDAYGVVENLIESYVKSDYKSFHDYAVGQVND